MRLIHLFIFMPMKFFSLLFLMLPAFILAQTLKSGKWGGEIHYNNESVPFSFEIGYPNGETPEITLINGNERRVIKNAIVTPKGIPASTKPINKGMDEHEQNGVIAPNPIAIIYASHLGFPSR